MLLGIAEEGATDFLREGGIDNIQEGNGDFIQEDSRDYQSCRNSSNSW